jgi:S1-C subfamily serine protease
VVQTAEYVEVEFSTGETVQGQVVSSTPTADLALVQVARVPRGAAVATLGDSDRVRVGDEVFVVGAPLGVSYTLTVGHLSGRRTAGTLYDGFLLGEFLQTDAAINPGNSGGPMFNMNSEVVGIVSYVLSESGGWAGLGFAVSTNSARKLLLERPPFWTGVEGYLLRGDMAKVFNLPQEVGVLVLRVADRSPAAQFGLRGGSMEANIGGEPLLVGGDIILRVMNIPVSAAGLLDIRERLSNLKAGDTATLTILRGGQQVELRGLVPAP